LQCYNTVALGRSSYVDCCWFSRGVLCDEVYPYQFGQKGGEKGNEKERSAVMEGRPRYAINSVHAREELMRMGARLHQLADVYRDELDEATVFNHYGDLEDGGYRRDMIEAARSLEDLASLIRDKPFHMGGKSGT
jgi:hypothetical protein